MNQFYGKRTPLLCFVYIVIASCRDVEYGQCSIYGTQKDHPIRGSVYFTAISDNEVVNVWVSVSNITLNAHQNHGIHIHEHGDLSNDLDGSSAGSHFIGSGIKTHQCAPNARSTGDMGNWPAKHGVIEGRRDFDGSLLQLSSTHSVIGRSIVIHELEDNCIDVSSSGSRIAWCVIGIGNPKWYPNDLEEEDNNTAEAGTTTDNTILSSPEKAICHFRGTHNSPNTYGTMWFEDLGNDIRGVRVTAEVHGLAGDNKHGLHIHEFGDISHAGGYALGGDFNPYGELHAFPSSRQRHEGDLGNLQYKHGSTYYYDRVDASISMDNIIGRGVAIHHLEDDGCSQPNGGVAGVLAHCVVGIANPEKWERPQLPQGCCTSDKKPDCECEKGSYKVDGDCVLCVDGAVCPGGDVIYPEKGHWNPHENNDDIIVCCNREACLGGTDRDNMCAEGYTGKGCSSCDSGFTEDDPEKCTCVKDSSSLIVILFVIAGLTFLIVLASIVVLAVLKKKPQKFFRL